MTFLTEHAVVASPEVLELLNIALWVLQTVRMETFAAKVTAEEVMLVAKRSTEVAHLFEDQCWVIERNLDRVRVPACVSLIIELKIFHKLSPLLMSWNFTFLNFLARKNICCQAVLEEKQVIGGICRWSLIDNLQNITLNAKDSQVWYLATLKHLFCSNQEVGRSLLLQRAACAAWYYAFLDISCNLSHK